MKSISVHAKRKETSYLKSADTDKNQKLNTKFQNENPCCTPMSRKRPSDLFWYEF